jgi:hypothetical protein
MSEGARGEGERADSARRRKRALVIAVLFAAGLFSGFYVGKTDPHSLFNSEASWNPGVSLLLTAVFLLVIVGGSIALHGNTDEVERQGQYKAVALAAAVYMLLYPSWFMLWKGGHVPEPSHGIVFIAFWLSLACASLWYRFR